jgi:hypothetical protein
MTEMPETRSLEEIICDWWREAIAEAAGSDDGANIRELTPVLMKRLDGLLVNEPEHYLPQLLWLAVEKTIYDNDDLNDDLNGRYGEMLKRQEDGSFDRIYRT